MWYSVLIVAAMLVGVILLWPREGRWGIRLSRVCCPNCRSAMPAARRPANARQAMWGGWTCDSCGWELDKYGQPVFSNTLCRGCGYDLRGGRGERCPECGMAVVR